MKVKCPNCGYEDVGNFCSNCGSPLPKHDVLAEGESLENRGPVTWFNKCPVCKSGKLLPATKKRGVRAQSDSHEELRDIDKGTLTLTSKRLVFSGAKRAINIDLKKFVSMAPYSDGIGLQISSKQKKQYFTGIDQNKLTISVEDRKYTETFSGLMLMYPIEGIIKQMD